MYQGSVNIEFSKTVCLNSTHKKEQKQKKLSQRQKSIVQINEQCCIQKINGKLEKYNQSKNFKHQKRLFKMNI